jgi:hypothetical protein
VRVRRLGKRLWDVLAVESDDGHCYVEEFLVGISRGELQAHARTLLFWLREYIPSNGPLRIEPHCKKLAPNLYEFRRLPRRGPKPRILWFEVEGKIVVCTHAVLKDQPKTDPGEIARAIEWRRRYMDAVSSRTLKIVED